MPPIRLHDLRHTWATLAQTAGVHPRVAQERLGHATVGITLGTYSHVTEGMQADAAALIAGMMTGPVSNPLAESENGGANQAPDLHKSRVRGGT